VQLQGEGSSCAALAAARCWRPLRSHRVRWRECEQARTGARGGSVPAPSMRGTAAAPTPCAMASRAGEPLYNAVGLSATSLSIGPTQ